MISDSLMFFKSIDQLKNKTTYMQGIPNYNEPTETTFNPTKNGIGFQNAKNLNRNFFFMERKDLIKISVEDQSTIENRIGFKRLLMVGIFALAWKKKQTVPLSFLIFEYKNDVGFEEEIYFKTESVDGVQHFTNIRYNLYKYWKECDEDPENIALRETGTVTKAAIAKDAKETAANNSCIGCAVAIIVLIVIAWLSTL